MRVWLSAAGGCSSSWNSGGAISFGCGVPCQGLARALGNFENSRFPVRIQPAGAKGILALDGTAVEPDRVIAASDVGTREFTPGAHGNGAARISWGCLTDA